MVAAPKLPANPHKCKFSKQQQATPPQNPAPADAPHPGDLDKENIRAVIRRSMGGIKSCYERALLADSTLQGKIVVSFTITPNGRVVDAVPTESFSPEVATCVTQRVALLRFPHPQDGVVQISYPFVFFNSENQPQP